MFASVFASVRSWLVSGRLNKAERFFRYLSPGVPSPNQTSFLCFGEGCQAAITRREGRAAWRLAPPFCLGCADTPSLDSVGSPVPVKSNNGDSDGPRHRRPQRLSITRRGRRRHETRLPAAECRGARLGRGALASPSAWHFFQMSDRSPGTNYKDQRHKCAKPGGAGPRPLGAGLRG